MRETGHRAGISQNVKIIMGNNKSTLCKCNNCGNVLIDQNPQTNAPLHELKGDELEMKLIKDGDGFYWACPMCNDDGFLTDL